MEPKIEKVTPKIEVTEKTTPNPEDFAKQKMTELLKNPTGVDSIERINKYLQGNGVAYAEYVLRFCSSENECEYEVHTTCAAHEDPIKKIVDQISPDDLKKYVSMIKVTGAPFEEGGIPSYKPAGNWVINLPA